MAGQSVKLANKRYRRDFALTMVVYIVAVIGGAFFLKTFDTPPVWVSALVALASSIPVIFVFVLMGRLLRETDEYTRLRQTEVLLLAGGITLSLCVTWGFLEMAEIVPHITSFWAGPLFFFLMGMVQLGRSLVEKKEIEA